MTDHIYKFIDCMRAHNLAMYSGELAVDGKLHRYRVEGDKSGSAAGWYVAHPGEPMFGAFGSWRTGVTINFASKKLEEMSDADRRTLAERRSLALSLRDKHRFERHAAAAKRAEDIWQMADSVQTHAYLKAKAVRPFGVKQFGGRLIVPLRDESSKLWSVQFIDADGQKRFLTGGRKRGLYHAIGLPVDTLCIAEGYATAASIYESTGYAVAVAFDAGNLEPVAVTLRRKFPKTKIVICADNDIGTPRNPGLTRALEAARAVDGLVALPTFDEAY